MGTEILRPQDCLKGRLHLDAFGSRPPAPPLQRPYRKKSPGLRSPACSSSPSPPAPSNPSPPKPRRSHNADRSFPPQQAKPPRRHRKSPSPDRGSASDGEIQSRRPLVMEEVRILRRGEELKPAVASSSAGGERSVPDGCGSALCSTDRIGPEPDILPKKMGFVDLGSLYAGPAFSASPSPSSLPIPGFFLKKAGRGAFEGEEATRALRSVLRLDVLR